jgi:PHD/YefM family antitoxin component YafN of YafNO toxin-antitoxin module
MQARERIRSISYLKGHAAQISEEVAATGAPVIVTQNCEAAMAFESVQQFKEQEERVALLKLLVRGEKNSLSDQGLSVEESRVQLAGRRQQR